MIRSLYHEMSSHNDGSIERLTGKTPTRADPTSTARSEHPDLGMVASRIRDRHPTGMPQYVGIPTKPFMTDPTYLVLPFVTTTDFKKEPAGARWDPTPCNAR